MNITKELKDEMNAVITVKVDKTDYEESVNKALESARKRVTLNGFRPGKVPMGVVKKMFYKSILVEEINKTVYRSMYEYLDTEKLNIIGEPMLNEEKAANIDWGNTENFEFIFDIGLHPEINYTPSKKDKVTTYAINIDETMRNQYIENLQYRMGSLKDIAEVKDNSMLRVNLEELNAEGNAKEGGVKVDEATVSMRVVKDEDVKKVIIGQKVGASFNIEINKLFPNKTDLAAVLKINKNKTDEINSIFKITINDIKEFTKADINQEFYDVTFGKDVVKSDVEFKTKVDEEIRRNLNVDSDRRFKDDIQKYLVEKLDPKIPETFLKRWLTAINKDKFTPEQIETDFPSFVSSLKWQLIKKSIAKQNNITIPDEEIKEFIKFSAKMEYFQYGYTGITDEQLDHIAAESMKNEEEKKRVTERLVEEKVISAIRKEIELKEKEISLDDFRKLNQKETKDGQ